MKNFTLRLWLRMSIIIFSGLFSLEGNAQTISTFAGTGSGSFSGDGGAATAAGIYEPNNVLADHSGNVYISEAIDYRVRKVNSSGVITTFAGKAAYGFSGDGGPATAARLYGPQGLAIDSYGNIYIADQDNGCVRRVSAAGIITTIAGMGEHYGYGGDGGPATAALFESPGDMAFDASGNLYITDELNACVRKVTAVSGAIDGNCIISTCAGDPYLGSGYGGDGGPATDAQLSIALGIVVDGSDNLLISDIYNNCIRKVTPSGIITNFAGIPLHSGFSGDGGPATNAHLYLPWDMCLDGCGNLLFGDAPNNRIRKINPLGIITTVAGDGSTSYSGDGGLATAAALNFSEGPAVDNAGNIYITDYSNNRVRMVSGVVPDPEFTGGGSIYITVCESGGTVDISSLLAATDTFLGQAETWDVSVSPAHGTLAGFPQSDTYLGSTLTPSGMSYTPTPGYSGSDEFTITITDCGVSFSATVFVTITSTGIAGIFSLCTGETRTLTDSTGGGTWSSSNTSVATIGSGTGAVVGVSAGTAIISYSISGGCLATRIYTVSPPLYPITGTFSECVGETTGLSDAAGGGTWTTSAPSIATVGTGTGEVTGISAGTATIFYSLSFGCYRSATFSVNPIPATISGSSSACTGASMTLTDGTSGGTWSSSEPGVATIGSTTGIVTGLASGTTTISYILATGCYITTAVTVFPSPNAITYFARAVCLGAPDTLHDATTGGTWSSGNTSIASVGSTGIITSVNGGTVTMSYTLSSGCSATTNIIIVKMSPIYGLNRVCDGFDTIRLHDTTLGGGGWTSTAVTVDTSGLVTGFSYGTAIVTFSSGAGCYVTDTIAVMAVPPVPVPVSVCFGTTVTLTDDTTGGTWASSNLAVATIGSGSGVLTPISPGTLTISYTSPNTGCMGRDIFTVYPLPTVFSITGTGAYCSGSSGDDIGLSGSQTGIHYQLYRGSSTVGGYVAGTGSALDFGLQPVGTYSVNATNPTTGCSVAMSGSLTVTYDPVPLPITGDTLLCTALGSTSLSDGSSGGHWTSNNTAIAGVGSSTGYVVGVSPGSDIITYTLTSGCFATTTVYVLSTTDPCSPCSNFGTSFALLGTSGSITSSVGPGNYYVGNNVTVYGTVTFTDAVMMIAPGDTMFFDTSAIVIMDSSHIFSCDMWQGMMMKSGHTTSSRLSLTHSTLIEDALTAVYVPSPIAPARGYVLDCDNAVFNRNMTGVEITHFTSLNSSYPFLIRNTIFTGRDFSGVSGYPSNWPPPTSLKAFHAPPTVFDPPYKIQNYTGTSCKNGQVPFYGVLIDSVGADTPNTYVYPGVAIPTYYSDIIIGDTIQTASNTYMNLFDNLVYGISAKNTNVTVVNNAFINLDSRNVPIVGTGGIPSSRILGGDGVYAIATSDDTNHNRLRVYRQGNNPYNNKFYGFSNGVEAYNYFKIIARNNFMINKNTGMGSGSPSVGPSGIYGYLMKSAKYDTIDISNDTINNVNNGVALWALQDPAPVTMWPYPANPWQYTGLCNITGNLIQASPLGYSSGMAQRVLLGISVQNVVAQFSHPVGFYSELHVDGNYLNDVYSGIYINNFIVQPATSNLNTIYLRPSVASPMQYGINHTLTSNDTVFSNYVAGSIGTTDTAKDSMRAYYSASNSKLAMSCNDAENTGRGFEFFIHNPMARWQNNVMTTNGKGFVLNGATVGTQGAPGSPAGNIWTAGGWNLFSRPETYVYHGSTASANKLYVSGAIGSTTYPSVNGGSPGPYVAGASLISTSTLVSHPCPYILPITEDSIFQFMAQMVIPYDYNVVPNNWMGQFKLWQALLVDSSMADSSIVIHVFDSMARNSRYAYITNIEKQIAMGNFDSATIMLGYNIDSMINTHVDSASQVKMADSTGADNIVENYQNFYALYIKYIGDTLTSTDSLSIMALAGLCPERNGTVVYQARALYSAVFSDLSIWNDDSCMNLDSTYVAGRKSNPGHGAITQGGDGQQYQLFPNPNDGNIILRQLVSDDRPVNIEVWDAIGRSVYRNSITFNGGAENLSLKNFVPGLYLLRLKDEKGREFKFKFVIE